MLARTVALATKLGTYLEYQGIIKLEFPKLKINWEIELCKDADNNEFLKVNGYEASSHILYEAIWYIKDLEDRL